MNMPSLHAEEAIEWERRYRERLDSAIRKIDVSLIDTNRKPLALTIEEMDALRQFIRKHHND